MSTYILTSEKIQKEYGKHKVLQNASIHIQQGEIYGLIGKNGSGKTTLLRIIAGLIPKYKGKVTIGNSNNPDVKVGISIFGNETGFDVVNDIITIGVNNPLT